MPTTSTAFLTTTTLTPFTLNVGGATGIVTAAGTSSPAIVRNVKNLTTGNPSFDHTTTWAALGVPANALVDSFNLTMDYNVSTYTSGVASTAGPARIVLNGSIFSTTTQATVSALNATYINLPGSTTAVPLDQQAPNTSVLIQTLGNPKTANTNGATVAIGIKNVTLTVTFTIQLAGGPLTTSFVVVF